MIKSVLQFLLAVRSVDKVRFYVGLVEISISGSGDVACGTCGGRDLLVVVYGRRSVPFLELPRVF